MHGNYHIYLSLKFQELISHFLVKDLSDNSDTGTKIDQKEGDCFPQPAKSEDLDSHRTIHADYGCADGTEATNDGVRLTHINSHGRASMVDVSKVGKPI